VINKSFGSGPHVRADCLTPLSTHLLSALLKRTATITQACAGSQTLRSGTVAFKILRCAIEVAYVFASVKAMTIKFLVWEKTTRKEPHPLEFTSNVWEKRARKELHSLEFTSKVTI